MRATGGGEQCFAGKGLAQGQAAQMLAASELAAQLVGDGGAVVKVGKAVGQAAVVFYAVLLDALAVVLDQIGQGLANVAQGKTVLVFGDAVRL